VNLGFKVQPRPLPRVLATGNEPTCGKRFNSTECHRPWGRAGGHVSANGQYMQAEAES